MQYVNLVPHLFEHVSFNNVFVETLLSVTLITVFAYRTRLWSLFMLTVTNLVKRIRICEHFNSLVDLMGPYLKINTISCSVCFGECCFHCLCYNCFAQHCEHTRVNRLQTGLTCCLGRGHAMYSFLMPNSKPSGSTFIKFNAP